MEIPQAPEERSEAEPRKKKKVERILIWIYDSHCLSGFEWFCSACVQIWTFSPQVIISRQFLIIRKPTINPIICKMGLTALIICINASSKVIKTVLRLPQVVINSKSRASSIDRKEILRQLFKISIGKLTFPHSYADGDFSCSAVAKPQF